MDVGKSSSWPPGPTVCRCCLAEGCYKDISTEYFWMGKREVYAEMLTETFDLAISYAQSAGTNSNSRLICEPCISRLRDASEFKRQVSECERMFTTLLEPGSSGQSGMAQVTLSRLGKDVKVERVKVKKEDSEDDDDDDMFAEPFGDDDDDDDADDEPLTNLATKIPKKEAEDDIFGSEDKPKPAEKRKATVKAKAVPAKKAKATVTKAKGPAAKVAKPQEKKKRGKPEETETKTSASGKRGDTEPDTIVKTEPTDNTIDIEQLLSTKEKKGYQRSAKTQSRLTIKRNATSILQCWSIVPFRWKKNRFICAYCDENFTDCSVLRKHVSACATEHSTKDIYSKFKEMGLINVDITDASCRDCAAPFTDASDMKSHVQQHGYEFEANHPDGILPFSLNKESWRCVVCHDLFNNFLKLYEHMNVHYQHYICAICGKGFMTAPRLRKHSEVHISGSFSCNECGRAFTMRAARDWHKAQAHAKAPRYECPLCKVRFDGYYERMNHLNEAHREREVSYQCGHCEQAFKTSGKRAAHVKSAHFPPERVCQCPCCEWQFRTPYELKRHMIKHTGQRNFHCSVCAKSFPRRAALKTHLKTHEDLRCRWCGANFKQKTQFYSHLRSHHPELGDLITCTVTEKDKLVL
ncbi:zinc finger protein 652-A isoform X5 [Plutella xylostella]|uniref:zinc finger protein 652-A isoform X5 n=1 Tax=Plutella xylostella TaxID=51655 RepID=UPI002032523C|nr:zinc finger protein 652-A isoform X5 [Plutella xylostella]